MLIAYIILSYDAQGEEEKLTLASKLAEDLEGQADRFLKMETDMATERRACTEQAAKAKEAANIQDLIAALKIPRPLLHLLMVWGFNFAMHEAL